MKIEMLAKISGTHDGETWPEIGDVLDIDDATALDLLNSGHAKPIDDSPVVEAAVVSTSK